MLKISRVLFLVVIVSLGSLELPALAQGKPTAVQLADYEAFRFWITQQPVETQRAGPDAVQKYADYLRSKGNGEQEIQRILSSVRANGAAAEIERWNEILTSTPARFNLEPNAFLVEMARTLKPGRALDVGMGQGRNTVFLAQHGWEAEGFDPADRAVGAAQDQASKLGVKITTHIATVESFDWSESKWDLIVISYAPTRESAARVVRALKPGGMVIVEGFHRDATKKASIGGGVVFDTNELLQLFSPLRVVRYEDTDGIGDFGRTQTRLVRLAAVKP